MAHDPLLYQAFQQAFNEHYERLCQYAFGIVKETYVCEDIVQDIFLHIWEKKPQLIGTESIRYYLYTAVRNNCLTQLQKNRKSPLAPLTGQEIMTEPGGVPDAEKAEADFAVLLQHALERLPPKCREVFVLSRMSKLTYQEIAESLQLSVKTVENQMGKALRIMRGFMREKEIYLLFWVLDLFMHTLR